MHNSAPHPSSVFLQREGSTIQVGRQNFNFISISMDAHTHTHINIHIHIQCSFTCSPRSQQAPDHYPSFSPNFWTTFTWRHINTHTCRNSLKLSISENLNSNMRCVYILYISGSATSHCFYHQLIWLVLSWLVIWYSFRGATNRQKWSPAACMLLI